MSNLEELETKMLKANEDYIKIRTKRDNRYDMIIGCLNRISVSDDEDEVERCYDNLIKYSISDYKDTARQCHQKWVVYDTIMRQYIKERDGVSNE